MSEHTHVHVCAPPPTEMRIIRSTCWGRCQRRRYLLVQFYEWYGATVTCLRCGDRWSDGELMERPFAPDWRKKSVERAKARWRNRSRIVQPLSPEQQAEQQEGTSGNGNEP